MFPNNGNAAGLDLLGLQFVAVVILYVLNDYLINVKTHTSREVPYQKLNLYGKRGAKLVPIWQSILIFNDKMAYHVISHSSYS